MRKLLLLMSLFLSIPSYALSKSDVVVAECKRQMTAGICMTRPDRSTVSQGETMLLSGAGRVSYAAYLDYMDLYNLKDPTDSTMCELARKYMLEQPSGDHAKIARALWEPIYDLNSENPRISLSELGVKSVLIALSAILTFTLTSPRQSPI